MWNQPYIWRIAGLVVRPQLLISDSALTLFILGFHTYPSLLLHFLIGTGGKYFIPIPQIMQDLYIYMLSCPPQK